MDVNEFKQRIDEWISVFRKTRPVDGKNRVLIPGDPEHDEEKIRRKEGIPLNDAVVKDLLAISKTTGIPFDAT